MTAPRRPSSSSTPRAIPTLRAARVSLGALGVLTEVTLAVRPARSRLHRVDEPRPLDETLDRLDELVDANDHFEFFAFPYTRHVR